MIGFLPAAAASEDLAPLIGLASQARAQAAQPTAQPQGRGGFFGRLNSATQSPLFGLGVGLLNGSPQAGFQNALALQQAQTEKERLEQAQKAAALEAQVKARQQAFENNIRRAELAIKEKNALSDLEKEAGYLYPDDKAQRDSHVLSGLRSKRKSGELANDIKLRRLGLDVSKYESAEEQRALDNQYRRDRLAFDKEKEANKAGAGAKLTEGQRKFATFGRLAENAQADLVCLEEKKNFNPTLIQPNALNLKRNKNGQAYVAAKQSFIDAIIRPMTGAAVTEFEFQSADRRYFPQIGDTPETVEFKRGLRQEAIDAIKAGAGADAQSQIGAASPSAAGEDDPLGIR